MGTKTKQWEGEEVGRSLEENLYALDLFDSLSVQLGSRAEFTQL